MGIGMYMFFRPYKLVECTVVDKDGNNTSFIFTYGANNYKADMYSEKQYEMGQVVNLYVSTEDLKKLRETNPKQIGLLLLGIGCIVISLVWFGYFFFIRN